ncbi:flap endonuclease Xni [Aeromonas jandaei]|uniref:Flap endonuclease Xni n=1 Tax=Aeromonas jandaei TaxID=650 RepID=A0A7T4ABU0_AERJA|nr:flap endonuclease Xni [Aeromonas jandaei]QQB20981.1 flap endonuclease Xni [Aeromonas jandaei]UCA31790.1 flap endonuclease Xni [Aeromonas jandaei]
MSNLRPHLLIIDALNLIRRLHAVQSQQALTPAQALVATRANLVNTCRKLLANSEPTHVIAVFDGEVHSWRKEIYPAYKEGRTPMPPELREWLGTLQDAFWECGIDALLSETDEADDLIATLASGIAQHEARATIISTDKGFCQLICPQIQIRDYFNKRWLDAAFVEQQYGVAPTQLVDFWALTGIGGSNIKGVPGIGPKTATQLLLQYGDLATMLAASEQEEAAKALLKLRQHREEALLAQRLVRLQQDIPLGFNLRDIRYPPQPE